MFIIKYKHIFIGISAALVVISISMIAWFGLRPGIDFTGGTVTQVSFPGNRPSMTAINERLSVLSVGTVHVQPIGENDYTVKTRHLEDSERAVLLNTLKGSDTMVEKSYSSIGPSVGHELARKAIVAIILVSLCVVLFIAFAFRGVSEPVPSWKYGVIAIGTLLHDIIIPTGIFAFLSSRLGTEVDTLFVVALLTVLGLSISDTIVIFDRIRENLKNRSFKTFEEAIGRSIEQTYVRSINTSLMVIIVLLALFFFGPQSTKVFALMLTAGMFFGTYSSIFLASPLLVAWEQAQAKKPRR